MQCPASAGLFDMTLPSLPVQKNFVFQRRADFVARFSFKYQCNPVNLTGYTPIAQVWDFDRTQKYQDFTINWVDQSNGIIELKLPYTGTVSLPGECPYDLMLISPSGLRQYYVEGILYESEGYSTP
jgi:hypothetical protein